LVRQAVLKLWSNAAALLVCAACAWLAYQVTFVAYSRFEMATAAQSQASFSATLNSLLARHESLPRVLALEQRVAAVLGAPQSGDARATANRFLEQVAERGRLLAVYVIDRDGRTIAASNWNKLSSFVGHSYSFRPYFRDAMETGFGRFYAIGSTTGEPGYFLAAAVMQRDRPLGVVTVKVDLKGLQAPGNDARETLAVVDRFGIVFLSSDPSLLYHPLQPLSDDALKTLRATQQYGKRLGPPLSLSAMSRTTQLLWHDVETPGWRLVSLIDMRSARWAAWAGAAGGGFAGAFVVALWLYARLRRRRAAEIVRSRDQLRHSEARLRAVANNLPVMVCFIDPQERYVFTNALYAQMYDRTDSELEGKTLREVLDPEEYVANMPYWRRALAGETVVFEREYRGLRQFRCFEATYRPEWNLEHTEVTGVHVMTQEVTETKRRLTELARLSQLDHLTQLLNRKGFDARLDEAIQKCRRDVSKLALLFIDLDGFKLVNDEHGHAVGDGVLCAFSKRLSRLVRADDAVARLGGDEFAVILPATVPGVAERLAEAIVAMAQRPFDIDGTRVQIGASVGGAYGSPGTTLDASALCREADARLYEAKRRGEHRRVTNPAHACRS